MIPAIRGEPDDDKRTQPRLGRWQRPRSSEDADLKAEAAAVDSLETGKRVRKDGGTNEEAMQNERRRIEQEMPSRLLIEPLESVDARVQFYESHRDRAAGRSCACVIKKKGGKIKHDRETNSEDR